MTTETTPAADPREGSMIELTVSAYLLWDDINSRWTIDPTMVDGAPLDTEHGVRNDLDGEHWTPEILADMEAAEKAPRPDAEQLLLLLLEALPEDSRIRDAMAEIREGAENWANELRNHIATASEANGEHQSAANQLETADAIINAVNLLSV